jgi:hypothetical protein
MVWMKITKRTAESHPRNLGIRMKIRLIFIQSFLLIFILRSAYSVSFFVRLLLYTFWMISILILSSYMILIITQGLLIFIRQKK